MMRKLGLDRLLVTGFAQHKPFHGQAAPRGNQAAAHKKHADHADRQRRQDQASNAAEAESIDEAGCDGGNNHSAGEQKINRGVINEMTDRVG